MIEKYNANECRQTIMNNSDERAKKTFFLFATHDFLSYGFLRCIKKKFAQKKSDLHKAKLAATIQSKQLNRERLYRHTEHGNRNLLTLPSLSFRHQPRKIKRSIEHTHRMYATIPTKPVLINISMCATERKRMRMEEGKKVRCSYALIKFQIRASVSQKKMELAAEKKQQAWTHIINM